MSINIIVTTPAKTGITAINKYAVISQLHTNNGIFINVMPGALILNIVVMIFMDPKIEETPITWTENIKKLTVEGA
jgi:hypothetical protein